MSTKYYDPVTGEWARPALGATGHYAADGTTVVDGGHLAYTCFDQCSASFGFDCRN